MSNNNKIVLPSTRKPNSIYMFGRKFELEFFKEDLGLVSAHTFLPSDLKSAENIEFFVVVDPKTGGTEVAFCHMDLIIDVVIPGDPLLLHMSVPGYNSNTTIKFEDLLTQRPTGGINDRFIDWQAKDADRFLHVTYKLFETGPLECGSLGFRDVECFLNFVQKLDWDNGAAKISEKDWAILAAHVLNPKKNTYLGKFTKGLLAGGELRYTYPERFAGQNGKTILDFCVQNKKFPVAIKTKNGKCFFSKDEESEQERV